MQQNPSAPWTWLTDQGRVAQLHRALLQSDSVRVHVDGLRQPMPMRAQQLRVEAGKGLGSREYFALRPSSGEYVLLPFVAGGGTSVWFSDPAGSYAFRVAGLTMFKHALCVPPPLALLRFARRSEPRYVLTEDTSAACAPRVATFGDPDGRPARLVNVSLGGALLHVTGDEAPVGSEAVKVTWMMPKERRVDLSATVVDVHALDPGRYAVAVQFNASTGTQTTPHVSSRPWGPPRPSTPTSWRPCRRQCAPTWTRRPSRTLGTTRPPCPTTGPVCCGRSRPRSAPGFPWLGAKPRSGRCRRSRCDFEFDPPWSFADP